MPSTMNSQRQPPKSVPTNSQQPTRDGGPNQGRHGQRRVQNGDGSSSVRQPEPVGQVDDHSGEETGLRQAQEKTDGINLPGSVDEGAKNRHHSPGNHDS